MCMAITYSEMLSFAISSGYAEATIIVTLFVELPSEATQKKKKLNKYANLQHQNANI